MRHLAVSLLVLSVFALAACGGGSSGTSPTDGSNLREDAPGGGEPAATGGLLRIRITDAPFPFDYVARAEVTIREVRVRNQDEEGEGGWQTVFEGEETVDLVPLQNGVSLLLVEADVGPGTYDEVRMIVDAGEVELSEDAWTQDGDAVFSTTNGKLHFPSGAQSGIKVKIDNEIVVTSELSGDLELDFALTKNFVFNGPVEHAPGVKRVIFTPVVRATNVSTAGSLQVAVRSDNLTPGDTADDVPLEGATVHVYAADADPEVDDALTSGDTDGEGVASFSLAPGLYVLVAEAKGHAPGASDEQTVVLANLTDAGDLVLAVTGEITGVVMSNGGTPDDDSDDVVLEDVAIEARADGGTDLAGEDDTDGSGLFQILGLEPGLYDLTFVLAGFEDGALNDIASALSSPGYTVVLKAEFTDVSGTVTDATATAISGATVTVVNADGTEVASTTTATDGTWSLTLATGAYAITFATSDATSSTTENVTVEGATPANTQTVDVTL